MSIHFDDKFRLLRDFAGRSSTFSDRPLSKEERTPCCRIAGVQFIGHADRAANRSAERMVREAAARGARIACLPELFNTMYFCVETKPEYFDWAESLPGPTTERMGALARELGIVLIAPVFEKAPDGRYFNAAAVLGPDGRFLGKYRKSSIPFMDASRSSEPRGNEKYYFTPGDLGFPTFDTPFARIGILICYDRHFRGRRVLGLGRAEIIVPTATTRMTRYLWDVELGRTPSCVLRGSVNKVGVDVRVRSAIPRQQHDRQRRARCSPRPAPPPTISRWPTSTCRRFPRCARSGATTATGAPTSTAPSWTCRRERSTPPRRSVMCSRM
jgi:predicted amidohydrolase